MLRVLGHSIVQQISRAYPSSFTSFVPVEEQLPCPGVPGPGRRPPRLCSLLPACCFEIPCGEGYLEGVPPPGSAQLHSWVCPWCHRWQDFLLFIERSSIPRGRPATPSSPIRRFRIYVVHLHLAHVPLMIKQPQARGWAR